MSRFLRKDKELTVCSKVTLAYATKFHFRPGGAVPWKICPESDIEDVMSVNQTALLVDKLGVQDNPNWKVAIDHSRETTRLTEEAQGVEQRRGRVPKTFLEGRRVLRRFLVRFLESFSF